MSCTNGRCWNTIVRRKIVIGHGTRMGVIINTQIHGSNNHPNSAIFLSFQSTFITLIYTIAIGLKRVDQVCFHRTIVKHNLAFNVVLPQFFQFFKIMNFHHLGFDSQRICCHRTSKRTNIHDRGLAIYFNIGIFLCTTNPLRYHNGLQPYPIQSQAIHLPFSPFNSAFSI